MKFINPRHPFFKYIRSRKITLIKEMKSIILLCIIFAIVSVESKRRRSHTKEDYPAADCKADALAGTVVTLQGDTCKDDKGVDGEFRSYGVGIIQCCKKAKKISLSKSMGDTEAVVCVANADVTVDKDASATLPANQGDASGNCTNGKWIKWSDASIQCCSNHAALLAKRHRKRRSYRLK